MACITQLASDNISLLNQLQALINELSVSQYGFNNGDISSGTIGAHVRHVIEHYQSFLKEPADIDYDERPRNQLLETNPVAALTTIEATSLELEALARQLTLHSVEPVLVSCATNTQFAAKPVHSSCARELIFLASHTTHHMAIIRILAKLQGKNVAENFGKAASTQQYESAREQLCV